MNKKTIAIIILIISVLLVITGVVMIYTSSNVITSPVQKEKNTINDELYNKIKEKLSIEDDSLEYVKTEENKYYFNKLGENKEVVATIIYDSEKDTIKQTEKNEISEGTAEPGSSYTGPIDPNDKVN